MEQCNRLRFFNKRSDLSSTIAFDLLTASTNLNLTETIQGINQNTVTGSFQFKNKSKPKTILDLGLYR
jgi:hypothetical protein